MGLKIKSPGAGGGVAAWSPTWNASPGGWELLEPGILGNKDISASRLYFDHDFTSMCLIIEGTSAVLKMKNAGNYTIYANGYFSVDGGSVTGILPNGSGFVQLFSGLSDEPHTVTFYVNNVFGNGQVYIQKVADALTVTGANPRWRTAAYSYDLGDATFYTAARIQSAGRGGTWTPDKKQTQPGGMTMVAFQKGSINELFFGGHNSDYVFASFDGGLTRVDISLPARAGHYLMPSNAADTIYIWAGDISNSWLSIGADAPITFLDLPKQYVWGHSITAGSNSTPVAGGGACTDMTITAAYFNRIGHVSGTSGNTIANLKARIDGELTYITTVAANDVAILDIGRNDDPALWASVQTDYGYILDALLTKGFQKVLCLSVLTDSISFASFNSSMSSYISGRGDSEIVYIDRSAYEGHYAKADGVHPTWIGYQSIHEFNKTYLAADLAY